MAAPDMKGIFDDAPAPDEEPMAEESESSVPPDFETHAVAAFPDMEGDPARLQALYDAIEACKGGGGDGLALLLGGPKGKGKK